MSLFRIAAFRPVTDEQLRDRPEILQYLYERLPVARPFPDAPDADSPPDSPDGET